MAAIEAGRNHVKTPQIRLAIALPLAFCSSIPRGGGRFRTRPGNSRPGGYRIWGKTENHRRLVLHHRGSS